MNKEKDYTLKDLVNMAHQLGLDVKVSLSDKTTKQEPKYTFRVCRKKGMKADW